MTGKARNYRNELDRIADALIEDILATPDEEIIAEAREDYGDPGRSPTRCGLFTNAPGW